MELASLTPSYQANFPYVCESLPKPSLARNTLLELNSGCVANHQRRCFSVSIKTSPFHTRFRFVCAGGPW
jgi:hypothetical protein